MSEGRFAGVTYRGLQVAQRAKISELSPTSVFVEHEAPLPVGSRVTLIEGASPQKVQEGRVVAVVEQESAAKSPPGMRVEWGVPAAKAVVIAPAAPPAPEVKIDVKPEPKAADPDAPVAVASETSGDANASGPIDVVEHEVDPDASAGSTLPTAAGNGAPRKRRSRKKTTIGRP